MHEKSLSGLTILVRKITVFLPLSMAVMVGCSGLEGAKPIANLVPCSGTVTFLGDPLDHGTVRFAPVDLKAGQTASGVIKEGKFKMVTTVSAEGVVAGKYKVLVESLDPIVQKPGEPVRMEAAPSLIPVRYNAIETSGIEVEVKQGMGPVTIELKEE